MMHRHVVVFLNELWWSTRSDNDYSKADCYLIYHGKCKFSDSIPLTTKEWDSHKNYLTAFGEHYFQTLKEQEEEENKNLHSTSEDQQAETKICIVQAKASRQTKQTRSRIVQPTPKIVLCRKKHLP